MKVIDYRKNVRESGKGIMEAGKGSGRRQQNIHAVILNYNDAQTTMKLTES